MPKMPITITTTTAVSDLQQLAGCIFNLLTMNAKNLVTLYEEDYIINDMVSGTCLLKIVISE